MINVNFGNLGKPKFKRPELLNNDVIPLCLAGVNPRTLMGEERWKPIRIRAYEDNNRCCWACGRTPKQDKFENHLEGHERYLYESETCIATMIEVVALCRTCHYFVHIGRTVTKAKLSVNDIEYIIKHGFKVLDDAGLSAMPHVIHAAQLFFSPSYMEEHYPKASAVKYDDTKHYVHLKLECEDKWVLKWENKYYQANRWTARPKEVKWKPKKKR
jgi:hypothetical protein